jgi:hypothetical protein
VRPYDIRGRSGRIMRKSGEAPLAPLTAESAAIEVVPAESKPDEAGSRRSSVNSWMVPNNQGRSATLVDFRPHLSGRGLL